MRLRQNILILAALLGLLFTPATAYTYPDEEKAQLSLTGVTAQAVQMYLTGDNRYLYAGFNNQVKIIDMGTFDLKPAAEQPYDFGSDSEYNGVVGGLTLSSNRLYVTKDDGKMLYFSLSDIAAKPNQVTISSGKELGKVALNTAGNRLYIINEDNNNIAVYTPGTGAISTIGISPTVTGASITDMYLGAEVSGGTDYIYITTDKGLMFYIVDGNTVATEAAIVSGGTATLKNIGMRPDKNYVYVTNYTDKKVIEMNSTTLAVTDTTELKIDTATAGDTYNTILSGLVSKTVTSPSSVYTFISGLEGVSVLDANNSLIDVTTNTTDNYDYNPILITGSRYGPMISGSDQYIYLSGADGSISVITENPLVTISGVVYSGGGSSMGVGESATITFQSDEDGTYKTLIGGSIDESGTAVTSSTGTGSVTAATNTDVVIAYNDNSSILAEGSNTVFIFVTNGSNTGRDATTVTVDTPPPAVTVTSTGFGNTRIYVNMTRLTVSDMSYYNVYVSTDADAVVNRTVAPTRVSQPSSGSTVTAEIGGLANDSLYYVSVEAVDAGGNVGPLTTTLPNGSRITGSPEVTVGPAQLMGEKGCSLSGAWVPGCLSAGVLKLSLLLIAVGVPLFLRLRNVVIAKLKTAVIASESPACRQAGKQSRFCPACHPEHGASRRLVSLWLKGSRSIICATTLLFLTLLIPATLMAQDTTYEYAEYSVTEENKNPQWWSTEIKGGFWIPTNSQMKEFFSPCCHMTGMIEQGFLYHEKYGVGLGVGFLSENGSAHGAASGAVSQDRFNLFLLPIETNLVFRADFLEEQVLVPYVKFGIDYVYFRQNLKGNTVNGVKYGLHTIGGLQILLDMIGGQSESMEDFGINDIYLILEGRYNWINDFGGGGLNLSSMVFSFGLLFEY